MLLKYTAFRVSTHDEIVKMSAMKTKTGKFRDLIVEMVAILKIFLRLSESNLNSDSY
jgi:hypothetical protein